MKCITGITITVETAQRTDSSTTDGSGGLHDQIGSSLTKIQSCAVGIERPAWPTVENHQRVESVQMKLRQAFCPTHDNGFRKSAAQHVSTSNNRIGGRRASRRYG